MPVERTITSAATPAASNVQSPQWISSVSNTNSPFRLSDIAQVDNAFEALSDWARQPVATTHGSASEQAISADRQIVVNTISAALRPPNTQSSLNLSLLAEMPNIGPLPEALISLLHLHPHIKDLNLAGYPKISLPESLFNLPKDLKIDLSGAQLRHVLLADIHERMQDAAYEGPRFSNYPAVAERPTPEALQIDLDSWTKEAPTPEFVKARAEFSAEILKGFGKVDEPRTCLIMLRKNCDAFPEEGLLLTHTCMVDLGENSLTSLPRNFFKKLQELEVVSLYNNHLTTLPPGIENLSNLRTLSLKNNHLTEVPVGLSELPSLKSVTLSRNRITSVDLSTLPPNLTSLDISRKGPIGKPDDFAYALKQLSIREGALPQLEDLDLNGNRALSADNVPPAIFTLGLAKPYRPNLYLKGTAINQDTYQDLESKAIAIYSNRSSEPGLQAIALPYPSSKLRIDQ